MEALVPLKAVSVHATIDGGLVTTKAQLVYRNNCSDVPFNVTFECPLEKDQVLTKLTASIGSKTINS